MSVELRNTSPVSLLFIILSDVGIVVWGFIIMMMYFIGLRGENLLRGIAVPPRVDLGIWVAVVSLAGMGLSWLLAVLFHAWDSTVNYNRVRPYLNLSGSEATPTSLERFRVVALLSAAGVIAVLVALRAFYLDVTLADKKTYARADEIMSADDCIAKGVPLTRSAYREISEAMNYQSSDREEKERQHARFRGKRVVVRARITKIDGKLLGGVKIQIDLYGARVWLNFPKMGISEAKAFQAGQTITAEGRIGDAMLHELKFHDCVIRSVE